VTTADWVVGVDLGGTKIALGLIDPSETVVARRRIPTNADDGPDSVVARIAENVAALQAHLPDDARIGAVGICTPGPVDHEEGVLIDPPNLPALHHTPLREMLAARLREEPSLRGRQDLRVCLEHDAKAAALGEFHYGSGRGSKSMVYIVVGTGVGAAIILDGQLYRGIHNTAGEIGHTTLDPHGELCACGSRGCLETYLGGPWLAEHYRRARHRSGPPLADGDAVTGKDVTARAEAGDPLAQQVMTQAGRALGTAVATMAMVLDIERYVVGSSVAKAGDLLLEPARQMVPHCSYDSVSCRVQIVPTALQDDGPILGCGWLARQQLQAT
jgi:glucokinase